MKPSRWRPSRWHQWAPWVVMAVVLAVALAVGAHRPGPAPSATQRAAVVDAQLRCPSCEDVSVADSSAPTAVAVRAIVLARVRAGQSDGEIEGFLVSRYGPDILLRPPATGATGTVWIVPVVAVVVALGGLGVFFWRRRRAPSAALEDEDRALVDQALAARAASEART
jgi:cytochrome c-type biogenesis protein CcmH